MYANVLSLWKVRIKYLEMNNNLDIKKLINYFNICILVMIWEGMVRREETDSVYYLVDMDFCHVSENWNLTVSNKFNVK